MLKQCDHPKHYYLTTLVTITHRKTFNISSSILNQITLLVFMQAMVHLPTELQRVMVC